MGKSKQDFRWFEGPQRKQRHRSVRYQGARRCQEKKPKELQTISTSQKPGASDVTY